MTDTRGTDRSGSRERGTAPEGGGRRPGRPPSIRPTSASTLVVAGLAAAGLAWLVISNNYSRLPRLSWLTAVIILALAGVEAILAFNTRARILRKPGAPPVQPLAVARFVALAKASSVAGAIFAGGYLGLLPWLLLRRGTLTAASNDLPPAIAGAVAGAALIAAALWLERSCRVPRRPEDEDRDK